MHTSTTRRAARIAACLVLALAAVPAGAQKVEDLMRLSLDDILNLKIVSASKAAEDLFDAPLSASAVTREEILRSGATSLPEALRLLPGVIVRQQVNGVYDVHLRGLDNIPPNELFSDATNRLSLIMIDNRIVYNYLDGGTFWENLPVDLADVERIEIVRGPVSALYGPNAVTGVIHIITRRAAKDGWSGTAHAESGSVGTTVGNAWAAFRKGGFEASVSGNTQVRDRFQTEYYVMEKGRYETLPDSARSLSMGMMLRNMDERFPEPERGLERTGFNATAGYSPNDRARLTLRGGCQWNRVQNLYVDIGAINLNTLDNSSHYYAAEVEAYGFMGHVSLNQGEQENVGSTGGVIDFTAVDAGAEYAWQRGGLKLSPGFGYHSAEYNWSDIGGEMDLSTYGFSLRSDYTAGPARFVAAVRGDKYQWPDKWYPSYEAAVTVKAHPNHLVRVTASRANRSSFLAETYFHMDLPMPFAGMGMRLLGNKDLKLITSDMLELGLRSRVSGTVQTDLEVFYSRTRDFNYMFSTGAPQFINGLMYFTEQYQNLKLSADQAGATFGVAVVPASAVQLRAFVTLQATDLSDYAPDLHGKPDSLVNAAYKGTPSWYGGFSAHWKPGRRWDFNANVYAYGKSSYDHRDYVIRMPFPPYAAITYKNDMDVASKAIVNVKAAFALTPWCSVSVSGRNLLGSDDVEFGFADRIGRLVLAGLHLEK